MPPTNVFIDTISPTVTLLPQQISISVNDTIPDITATITDEDPNLARTRFQYLDQIYQHSLILVQLEHTILGVAIGCHYFMILGIPYMFCACTGGIPKISVDSML